MVKERTFLVLMISYLMNLACRGSLMYIHIKPLIEEKPKIMIQTVKV